MAAEGETILYELNDDVACLRLNQPDKLNALSPEMLLALPRLMGTAVADGARAIVVTGMGRGFCSGAQLGADGIGDRDLGNIIDGYYNPLARAIAELPVPLVTSVNGIAAGAGASLALAGDIIIAARSASIVLAFANIGLVPDAGATWAIAKSAGRVRALELALLGGKMPAEEAKDAGLITRVVDDEQLTAETESVARKLASMPTMALAMIRQQVRAALDGNFEESLLIERDNQRRAGFSEDHAEGVKAFTEKRAPRFKGK